VASALRADGGGIALVNPDSGRLEVEAWHGPVPDGDTSFAPGQGIPGWAALHGAPVLVADTAADSRYRELGRGVRSQVASPLFAPDGQVFGVMFMDSARKSGFGREELGLLSRAAAEAARVLQRLWELDHLQEKARQLETLADAAQRLVSKLEQQELFDTLTRDGLRLMRARACSLCLHSPSAATMRMVSLSGASPPAPIESLPIDACLGAAALRTRHPVAFADVQSRDYLDLLDIPRDPSLRSALSAPVAYEGEALGVLTVYLGHVHRFNNDEKRLALAFANIGAVALQNARLYARVFQSEESLHKNERLTTLGLLSAEIAHEIRNPLTVLKLLHGGLGLDFPEGDPRRKDMRVIAEKLDQLEATVTRVLNFGKAPSSLRSRCSLADIVEDTLLLVRLKLSQGKIHVQFARPPQPLIVDGHKGQLQQVLLNLLINAMHAMPGGGKVAITLDSDPEHGTATLDVADTGSGIPQPVRDHLFDSFLSGRPDGTGLGLAIAKRALLSHGGDIALVSTGPSGTTFRIRLPLAKA
jgi:signal transduction histidine kinase/putative methionine-R-sulfoxide reductase with GAF domain